MAASSLVDDLQAVNVEPEVGAEGSSVLGREDPPGAPVPSSSQAWKHTELLNGEAADVWMACKHAVALLPNLAPQYFSQAEFVVGSGGPGSVAVFHFGSARPGGGSVKHRIDIIDEDTQTLTYTVIVGDTANYSAEMHFTATEDNKTEATWTSKYEPGDGEATAAPSSAPESEAKEMVMITFKTLERAVKEGLIVRHMQTLEAPVDTIWNILMNEDVILPKVIPHIIASYEYLEGNGEPGSIRLLQLGNAIPGGKHVVERIDINDASTKTWGYTVLQGDPHYKYLSAMMSFLPGPQENTSIAKWVGVHVPHMPNTPSPKIVLHVWKVFENVAKSSPQVAY